MVTERNKLSLIKICHFRKTFWKAVLQPLVTPTRGLDVDSSAVNVFHHTQVLVLEWLILIQGWNVFSDVWAQRPSTLFLQHTAWTGTEVMRSSNRAAQRLCPDAVAPGEVWEKIGFPDIYVYFRQGFSPRSRCGGSNKTVHTMAGKLIFFFLSPKETVTFEECYKLKCQKLSQSWGKKKEKCWITHTK